MKTAMCHEPPKDSRILRSRSSLSRRRQRDATTMARNSSLARSRSSFTTTKSYSSRTHHLLPRALQPPSDGFVGILAARTQAVLKILPRGRHDKDGDGLGQFLLHLAARPARRSPAPGRVPASPRLVQLLRAACHTSACRRPGRIRGSRPESTLRLNSASVMKS